MNLRTREDHPRSDRMIPGPAISFQSAKLTEQQTAVEVLLYTPEQAAEALGIGRTRLYQLLATKQLQSVTIGTSRRVSKEALRRFVASLEAA